jgi:twinkle protein
MPFLENHFKYYRLSENDLTIDAILDKARQMVKQIGINVVVIDNMSTVEKSMSNQTDTRHHQIKNMMNDVARFARLNDVHVILVAHPKKMSELKTGVYKVPNGYDVGDSSHWYNLPDNGLTVYRNFETRQTEVHRWKVRFRYTGEVGHSCFFYNLNSNTFTPDVESKSKFVGQPNKEQVQRFSQLADPF